MISGDHLFILLFSEHLSLDVFVKSHYPPPRRGGAEEGALKIIRIFSAPQRLRG
jgi:hypothetical protein